MDIEQALHLMRSYFSEAHRITHTESVLAEAETILATVTPSQRQSGFLTNVVRLACIFHDIGIPNAIKNHGSSAGPYQEAEGAALTPAFMNTLGTRADVAARVVYIVGNHHTRAAVDGLDFQIVWDADMLVNIREGNVVPSLPADQFIAQQFETSEGARRARELSGDHSG